MPYYFILSTKAEESIKRISWLSVNNLLTEWISAFFSNNANVQSPRVWHWQWRKFLVYVDILVLSSTFVKFKIDTQETFLDCWRWELKKREIFTQLACWWTMLCDVLKVHNSCQWLLYSIHLTLNKGTFYLTVRVKLPMVCQYQC